MLPPQVRCVRRTLRTGSCPANSAVGSTGCSRGRGRAGQGKGGDLEDGLQASQRGPRAAFCKGKQGLMGESSQGRARHNSP